MNERTLMYTAITMLPSLNSITYRPIIERCGGIEGFFLENRKALNCIYREFNLKPDHFDRKKAQLSAEKEVENIERYNISICTLEGHLYPRLLLECNDAPLVFYYKGNLTETKSTTLAIVGTRRSTEYSRNRIDRLLYELAQSNQDIIIVSGLAFGIDGAAHQAAIKHNIKTYAVLGHGLHLIYPAAHKNMAEQIVNQGGVLISEFPTTIPIHPSNFLKRNRIIAGISYATLIAESAEKGGAMSTARIAHSYNREIMAFPGRPEDKMSAGCNRLIKENIASLIENSGDIIKQLGLEEVSFTPRQTRLNFFEEENNSLKVLNTLQEKGGANIDELAHLTHIPVQELSAVMIQLELEEKVISLPGNNYIAK
ncbi:DNA-processing protein DprA [Porphyromonadaceae bacterium OttesenSCG-928-L07]|nr:DNA-processing protein DprA [Porphyromonadaceae bacterium OttesenSCG-928-L07]MDL2251867.1 DNA-processing protein DprA [Odoribacter sp. OttesenSCG-928-J03]MDL2330556.1 DNA-processing protein DprA [Odoribacter sp. OttesenSCG-928-A06]